MTKINEKLNSFITTKTEFMHSVFSGVLLVEVSPEHESMAGQHLFGFVH